MEEASFRGRTSFQAKVVPEVAKDEETIAQLAALRGINPGHIQA